MRKPILSIVLPCYNEEKNLPVLLENYAKEWPNFAAELILVDNGSTDQTPKVLKSLLSQSKYSFAKSVTVRPNQGYGHGILQGLHSTQGEFIAYSHADMQCHPKDVFRAFQTLQATLNPKQTIVKGRRGKRENSAEFVTTAMSFIATCTLQTWLTDINAQPKVFHRDLLSNLSQAPKGFEFDLYLLYTAKKEGYLIKTIDVLFAERAFGESKWSTHLFTRYKTMLGSLKYIVALRFINP